MIDAPPCEAEPFTRITRRLAPALFAFRLVSNSIALLQCAGLYRKERTDHGRQPARVSSLVAISASIFSLLRHPELGKIMPVRLGPRDPSQGFDRHPISLCPHSLLFLFVL